jgi:hypothetical protein
MSQQARVVKAPIQLGAVAIFIQFVILAQCWAYRRGEKLLWMTSDKSRLSASGEKHCAANEGSRGTPPVSFTAVGVLLIVCFTGGV